MQSIVRFLCLAASISLSAANTPDPLEITVDCSAGDDLRTLLAAGEAAAAARVSCGDASSDCVILPARRLIVTIAGTCALGTDTLRLASDDVTLRARTRGVTLLGTRQGTNIRIEGRGAILDHLRIECTSKQGTCVSVGYGANVEIYDSVIVARANENTTALGATGARVYLLNVTIEAGYYGIVQYEGASGVDRFARFSAFHTTVHALWTPVTLGAIHAQISDLTTTSDNGFGVIARGTELSLTQSRLEGAFLLDGAKARIQTSELGTVSARRSAIDVEFTTSADRISLEQFSTSVIDLDPGAEIGALLCDATSDAQCLEPGRAVTSTCNACPGASFTPPAPIPTFREIEASLESLPTPVEGGADPGR